MITGLSLSLCVKDVLCKRVEQEDIYQIVSNTAFPSAEAAYTHYSQSYWDGEWITTETDEQYITWEKDHVMDILNSLWGRVVQPRLVDPNYQHSIAEGHWVEV